MDLKSSTTGLLAIMIYNLKFSAQVVELVDTRDLKSLEGDFVPVQVRPRVPFRRKLGSINYKSVRAYFRKF